MALEKRNKQLLHGGGGWRVDFEPDNTGMTTQGQYDPISEMLVECYQHPVLSAHSCKNTGVIRPVLADLSRTNDIMPVLSQAKRASCRIIWSI